MNVSRRTVLGALGAGTAGLLAGCVGCKTNDAYSVAVELDSITPVDDGWDVAVTATTTVLYPDDDDTGSGRWEVALYDRERTVLDTAVVEPVAWADVPESARSEDDCGDTGAVSVTKSFRVTDPPAFVGPRFRESVDVENLDYRGMHGGLVDIGAVQYRGLDGSRSPALSRPASHPADTGSPPSGSDGDKSASGSGGNDTGTESDGDDTSSADDTDEGSFDPNVEWPPETVDVDAYESADVSRLPWPRPTEQTVTATDAASSLEFTVESACREHRRPASASIDDRDGDVYAGWIRATDRSCVRPILEDVTADDGTLTVIVGSNRVAHAYCRDCRYLEYRFRGSLRESVAGSIDEIAIEHHEDDGTIHERIVVPVE